MKFETSRRDLVISVVFIAVVLAVVGYGYWDKASKRAALEPIALAQTARHLDGLDRDELDIIEELVCEKAFGFFGTDIGVLRLYIRKSGDTTMESFSGIEYFFDYTDQGWELRDTAQIRLPAHIYEGYKVFEDHGFEVDPTAYERYNR